MSNEPLSTRLLAEPDAASDAERLREAVERMERAGGEGAVIAQLRAEFVEIAHTVERMRERTRAARRRYGDVDIYAADLQRRIDRVVALLGPVPEDDDGDYDDYSDYSDHAEAGLMPLPAAPPPPTPQEASPAEVQAFEQALAGEALAAPSEQQILPQADAVTPQPEPQRVPTVSSVVFQLGRGADEQPEASGQGGGTTVAMLEAAVEELAASMPLPELERAAPEPVGAMPVAAAAPADPEAEAVAAATSVEPLATEVAALLAEPVTEQVKAEHPVDVVSAAEPAEPRVEAVADAIPAEPPAETVAEAAPAEPPVEAIAAPIEIEAVEPDAVEPQADPAPSDPPPPEAAQPSPPETAPASSTPPAEPARQSDEAAPTVSEPAPPAAWHIGPIMPEVELLSSFARMEAVPYMRTEVGTAVIFGARPSETPAAAVAAPEPPRASVQPEPPQPAPRSAIEIELERLLFDSADSDPDPAAGLLEPAPQSSAISAPAPVEIPTQPAAQLEHEPLVAARAYPEHPEPPPAAVAPEPEPQAATDSVPAPEPVSVSATVAPEAEPVAASEPVAAVEAAVASELQREPPSDAKPDPLAPIKAMSEEERLALFE